MLKTKMANFYISSIRIPMNKYKNKCLEQAQRGTYLRQQVQMIQDEVEDEDLFS
jgi:ATP-dependent Lon protease